MIPFIWCTIFSQTSCNPFTKHYFADIRVFILFMFYSTFHSYYYTYIHTHCDFCTMLSDRYCFYIFI